MEFRLLGPLEARREGLPVPLPGRRPRMLLAALLLRRNEPVTTEQLVEMLWPDAGPAQPAKAVHVQISRLRRALTGGPASSPLETRDGAYVLRVDADGVDVDRFSRLVADGRRALATGDPAAAALLLEQALELWRGAPLADFTYEAFAQAEIGHLEELRLSAIEAVADAELALGRHAAVVPRLERLAAEHPLRERLHGQLMLALYRCGRQADALAAYRRLRDTLDTEVGLEPSPELRRLERRILQQEPGLEDAPQSPAPARAAPAAPRPVPLPEPLAVADARPLLGRTAELERIAAVAAPLDGARHLVLVSGDAGIGKTRLLAAAARQLEGDGWPVLYGRASEDTPVPYAPLVEALRHQLAHRPRLDLADDERLEAAAAPLAALLPELEPLLPAQRPPAWTEPEAGRCGLYVAFATVLARIAGSERLALVLDDLHWADAATLRLVCELIARPGSAELIVLGAYRGGEADPDSPLAPAQPLARLVGDLRRERRLTRISLGGLREEEVAALADALGSRPAPAMLRAVAAATRGNPFLLEHLLPEAVTARDLATLKVPDAIVELVGRRLQALPRAVTETIAAAAVLGEEFQLGTLEAIVPAELRPVLPALETAVERRLLECHGEADQFAFAHELLRRTLYAALSKSRAARLHLAAARALEAAGAPAVELAHHYWAARGIGGAPKAAACFVDIARAHARAHEPADAAARYRDALKAAKRAGDTALQCEALFGLATVLEALDIGKARAVYRRAAAVAEQHGDAVTFARAAVGFARFKQYGRADPEAVRLLAAADQALPADQAAVRALVQCLIAVRLDPEDEQGQRERLWREAVQIARTADDDAALTTVLRYAPYVLWRPESVVDRIAAAEETVRRAQDAGLADEALWGHVNAFVDRIDAGDVALADTALAAAGRLAGGVSHRWFDWYLPMLLATRSMLAGELAAGLELAESALRLRTRQEPGATETFTVQSAMHARLNGRVDDGVLSRLEKDFAHFRGRPVWRSLLVDLLIVAGRRDDARAALGPLLEIGSEERLPADVDRLAVLALTVEAAARLGETETAAHLVDALGRFPGRFAMIDRGWGCWGSTSRVLGIAAAGRGDTAGAKRHFDAAVREHTAAGADSWLAHTYADQTAALSLAAPTDIGP